MRYFISHRLRVILGLCLVVLVCAAPGTAQQNEDAVRQIVQSQIAWINSMVAQGKMSQADGNAQINKLKIQYADIALNTPAASESTTAFDGVARGAAATSSPSRSTRSVSSGSRPATSAAMPAVPAAVGQATSHAAPPANQQQVAGSTPSGGEPSPTHEPADMVAGAAQPARQHSHQGTGNQSQGTTAGADDQSEAKACPSDTVNKSLTVPALKPIEATTNSISGSIDKVGGAYPSGWVQLCDGGKPLGKAVAVSTKDGTFNVPATGDSLPRVSNGDEITAQFYTGTQDSPTDYGDVSPALMVGSCKAEAGKDDAPTFKRGTDNTGKATYTGTVTASEVGDTVRICDNDIELVPSVDITKQSDGSGTFDASSNVSKAKAGDILVAQVVSGSGTSKQYSKVSAGAAVGSCSAVESGDSSTKPTLNALSQGGDSFSGTLPGAKAGVVVRLCVDDSPVANATVKDGGAFSGVYPATFKAGQSVTAQEITSASSASTKKYGLVSPAQKVTGLAYSGMFATFIGGVEWAGYSSQAINTNGFLSASMRSGYLPIGSSAASGQSALGAALWTRIRLLSAPQPSAQGVSFVSAFSNPTGSITTSSLSNVGQAVDYVVGLELRFWQRDAIATDATTGKSKVSTSRTSFIIGGGATTPLPADTTFDTFNAPAANSQQCQWFLQRYGGFPGVYANTNTTPMTCLMNPLDMTNKMQPKGAPISYVSFTNQDRTNFYGKYGAGFRFTHVYPAGANSNSKPYSGTADFTIGQDQSMSAGKWWGPVLRVDAVYPIALGSSSLFYVFGSAGMRTGNNKTYPPLVLTSLPSGTSVTVPGPNVDVLPLVVPARDFYRIGVGLNVLDIFCKLKGSSGCSSDSGTNSANGGSSNNKTNKTSSNSKSNTSKNGGGSTTDSSGSDKNKSNSGGSGNI